ncbi:transcription elongation factor SPT6 isoform X1 [Cotesia glomerata]|uniref:transcription elongation factor SPT6 isoform X1 n=1 Tax=Cotesia glomerata TaxID=32391 RepID=UPI001D00A517|nr:transcription elongation factor SPT6 isoform X1 [Cotesia glomerata]
MADFVYSEAEESEHDDDEEEVIDHGRKKKVKKTLDESEEEEDDDEDKLREELKDLIDDRPIEESDGEDSDASGDSKKRKKSDDEDFDDRLEDDDYDLIEENWGITVERKRFKRLKRMQDAESDDEEEDGDAEKREREVIANEIFPHGEGSGDDRTAEDERSERSHRPEPEIIDGEGSEGEYSEDDDFIVGDDDRPIGDKRRKKKVFEDAALQEAQDIFGVDFDYDNFEKFGEDEYEEEDEDEDDYVDDEGVERPRRHKKQSKKKPSKKTIFEVYEPSELKRGHFTDLDNEIRNTDIPERMQLRSMPITPVPEGSDELDHEAEWIYQQAFCRPTISNQDTNLNNDMNDGGGKGPQTVGKIKKALDFMRNQYFEVPFISFYRKEYVLPELNINDLWKVYKYDAKWCQLRQRKENLLRLFEKMRDFQLDEIMKNPDAPLPDDVRVIKDDDIERLKSVQTNEELNDVHNHFMLYYSHDIPAMQEAVKRKEKAARQAERLQKRKQQLMEAEENGEDPPPEEENPDEVEEVEDSLKQAIRSGPYALCRRAGLHSFAKKFGLTPEHFAENLRDNYQRHEVDQDPVEPSVVAQEYVGKCIESVEEVLTAVKIMVAIQLAREPLVRKCVREMYMERAKISIRPTKKGITDIDENHPIYTMKYLKDKPVRDLTGDQWLKLEIAEKDKLIQISLSDTFAGNTSNNYIEEMKQLYIRDEFSKNVQDWNNLRNASVELALTRYVIPDLKKELRSNLSTEAKDYVMRACCRKLYNWLKVAPYTCSFPDEDDEEWDTKNGVRVMGIAYVPNISEAAFSCVVSPDGECADILRLPHLLKKKNSYRDDEKLKKEADLLAIRNFIRKNKPHVIVIGGESREAMMISADIKESLTILAEEEQYPAISVEILDNDLAKLYSASEKGKAEFRDYPDLLRQAVSLARRLQDPLVEFSQLCTLDEDILCLKYHSLQGQLSEEELLENLYLEFVNRVNEVGVDVNKAVQQNYSGNLVQFICGLGPRKGQALIKMLKQTNQRLENRTQLVTACHMGPKVFINCAGFIKIDTNSLGDSTEAYVEVLDGSRVHPETYEWARKMAVDALEYDDEDANPAGALEEILESPERLKDLDLDAFAVELERQGFGNKCVTLYDIRSELNSRYKDLRTPYQSPTPEQLFDILTKETPETFYIGKLMSAVVVGISHKKPQGEQLDQANPVRNDESGLWQCPFCLKNDFPELSEVWNHFDAGACPGKAVGVRIVLDNPNISGYVHIKNISDNHVADPEERLRVRQTIHVRIIKIEVDRFSTQCSCKTSDLVDKNNEWRPAKDPYYDTEAEQQDKKFVEDFKKKKQQQTYVKRVIVHTSFHNVSYAECEKMMKTLRQGEVIIRPSSKGCDHLVATWKVTDDIYQYIDIKEEDKANDFSLGRRLLIGNNDYEDLDEIIASHINPMAAYAAELLDFKYYKRGVDGIKDKAEEILREQKKENPGSIPYIISASKNYPGKFLLSYLPRLRCYHEFISVSKDGFRYRGETFARVDKLVSWFKKNFRMPIPGQATPSTPRGASSRTPYHTTPGVGNVNQEAIQRVAQNLPHHMLHSLSQVANQTPHYPPHTPGATGATGYGMHTYPNTPYTPSGQTPFMTPFQTPHHTPHHSQPTPRYGQQTPNHQFVHPGPPMSQNTHHRSMSHRSSTSYGLGNEEELKKAAEDWARLKQSTPRGSTPRYDDMRKPRDYADTGRSTPRNRHSSRTPSYRSPRGTPNTNSSPRSMSLSGDGTPLYDES